MCSVYSAHGMQTLWRRGRWRCPQWYARRCLKLAPKTKSPFIQFHCSAWIPDSSLRCAYRRAPVIFTGRGLLFLISGLRFPDDVELSDNAIDIVMGLLEMDPKKRLTATQAFDHPWLVPVLQHSTAAVLRITSCHHFWCDNRGKFLCRLKRNPRESFFFPVWQMGSKKLAVLRSWSGLLQNT